MADNDNRQSAASVAGTIDGRPVTWSDAADALDRCALVEFSGDAPNSLLAPTQEVGVAGDACPVKHAAMGSQHWRRIGLEAVLLLALVRESGIDISEEDIQQASDGFREANGLQSVADTQAWLSRQGLTIEHWGDCIESALALERLVTLQTADDIESWFAQNRRQLDRVELACLVVDDAGMAEEIMDQVSEGDLSFEEAVARFHSDASARNRGGYIGWRHRGDVPHAAEARLFDARPGALVGPVAGDDDALVYRVLSVSPAVWDAAHQERVSRILFRAWWWEQRRRVSVLT